MQGRHYVSAQRMDAQAFETGATHDSACAVCDFGLRAFALALALHALSPAAQAQPEHYPNRPITIVVPFPAGGLTDVPARLAATMLQDKLGQGVVIENRTGGSGVVGAAYAARATPDGYTLFANSLADTQNLHYLPVNYNPVDDFIQIGWIVDGPPLVLIINANLPFKTLGELLADAKANPNKYSFGTSGPASSPGLTLAQLNKAAQVQIQPVPYRGSGDAAAAAAGGAIQGAFTFFSQAKPLADDGKVRASRSRVRSGWRAGPTCRPSPSRATRSISAALSGSRRRPRRRSRSSTSSASTSTRWCRATSSRSGWRSSAWRRRRPPRTRRRSSTSSCATRSRGRASWPSMSGQKLKPQPK